MVVEKIIAIGTLFIGALFLLAFLFLLGFGLGVSLYNSFLMLIEKSKTNLALRNTITSILFTFIDMGPNISSVALIALVIANDGATIFQLILVFFFGFAIKEIARTAKNIFYMKLNSKEEYLEEDGENKKVLGKLAKRMSNG